MLSPLQGCIVSHGELVLQQYSLNYTLCMRCAHLCCFCGVHSQDRHLHTMKTMRVMAKAWQTTFIYLSLYHSDITGNAALEQWTHVAWLLSAERRPTCRDYLNFKLLHNLSESFLWWSNKTAKFYFCTSDCSVFIALQLLIPLSINIQSTSFHLIYFAQCTISVILQMCAFTPLPSIPLLAFTWINMLLVLHESANHTLGS